MGWLMGIMWIRSLRKVVVDESRNDEQNCVNSDRAEDEAVTQGGNVRATKNSG